MKGLRLIAVLGLSFFCVTACAKSPATDAKQMVTLESYKELQDLYQRYGYTFAIWRAGYRSVPRLFVTDVPERWSDIADKVTLTEKKELFYSAILPIVLQANEMIAIDRARAEPIAMRILAGQVVSGEERAFLSELAARYKIKRSSDTSDPALLQEILLRVDGIPPSLALAQAAYESAYATSRFAGLGNALYGQETIKGHGIEAMGNDGRDRPFQILDFESFLGSTLAYTHNLNTHKAYTRFRQMRADFRRRGEPPNSIALALTLTQYCELGASYTHEIARVIRNLKLTQADMAYLRDMKPVYIVPKKTKTD